jgi:hypothetical protein
VLDCFVYIRQDATQSYLEVLFYSIGAFNELQECSLKDNLYNWIPPIRYVNLPNPPNILTKASAEKTLRGHFAKASEKRL